jgi:hypothetical protein
MREVRPGVWQLAVTTEPRRRVFHSVHGDRNAARRELTRLAARHRTGPRTVDALVAIHLDHLEKAGRSPLTLRRYEQLWRTWLAPSLGPTHPDNLRPADIEAALRAMDSAGQSQRSIHQAAVVLNNALAWACDQRAVAANPVTGCELPNGTNITAARHR